MLGLKMASDPRWVNVVEKNIEEILTDHAWCEQKAATNAITLMVKYPHLTDLVDAMVEIAHEEITHFGLVHDIIKKRKYTLGAERKDPYVHDLMKYIRRGGSPSEILVDRLLFAAMIEARSCERFRILSQEINDAELRSFYHDLMISEANHYMTFISLARKHGNNVDVDRKWNEFLDYESSLMLKYGKSETIHG
ncbi:tRNA-(ms[2]io[6]A)-hydroxylase [Flavobacteriales bacterium]|nr:tRNA-(ms[2]io[6]A)-hydroxylase [Flavobacteriales bacterium]